MWAGRGAEPPPLPYRSWAFRSVPRQSTFDEERAFRELIRSALRVAAGLGCGFDVRWCSGPAGGVHLRVRNPEAADWFRESIGAAYTAGSWTLDLVPSEPADRTVRLGLLSAPSHLPLPFAVDRPPWTDTVLRGLGAGPPHVTIVWSAQPGTGTAPRRSTFDAAPETAPRSAGSRLRPASSVERRLYDAIDERRSAPPWAVRVEVRASGDVPERDVDRVTGLVEASTRLEGGNGIRFVRPLPALRSRARWLILTEPELIGLFPSPWVRASIGFRTTEPSGDGIPIGRSAQGRWVRAPVEPGQGRHLLILGETGMGKSSLLVRLLLGAARRGAVVLLDPIGDTGRQFVGALDAAAARRATWISPNDSPIGLNALHGIGPDGGAGAERADRALHELVMALRRVRSQRYAEGGFWGPRIEEVLARTLSIAARLPGGTLVQAHELLGTERALPFEVPPELRAAVHALRELVDQRPDEVAGSRRVLGEIARSRVLRRMLCDPTARFGWGEATGSGRITVITADAPTVGESTARYLLAVHLALLASEILGRPRSSKIFLGLDEAQWYAHDGLAQLLRLGRRANVHVWTTTQALRSLGEELHEAVLTNSADLVLFRGDPEEARAFNRWSRELSVERLMALPRGGAAALVGKGNTVEWVASGPLRPDPERSLARRAEIRRTSVARWGRSELPEDTARLWGSDPSDPVRTGEPDRTRELDFALLFLREWVGGQPSNQPILVDLRSLRDRLGLDPEGGRRVGSELRRLGLLVGTQGTREGTVWTLAATGWEVVDSSPLPPELEKRLRALLVDPAAPDIRRGGDKLN